MIFFEKTIPGIIMPQCDFEGEMSISRNKKIPEHIIVPELYICICISTTSTVRRNLVPMEYPSQNQKGWSS